jgi:glycosyltransferase involved in cell wall biosynthesis
VSLTVLMSKLTLELTEINHLDLVMWTLNGSKTLTPVLNRINQVIPERYVNQRLIVDDGSVDDTVEIAKSLGWKVILNEGKGISDGANTALKHVETDWFCSFEQDIILLPNWYNKIIKYTKYANVAVAQGVRYVNHFLVKGFEEQQNIKGEIRSLDNTIYNTAIMRGLGGFPNECHICIDANLKHKVESSGYVWFVDKSVVSVHLRKDFFDYLFSLQKLWSCTHKGAGCYQLDLMGDFKRFLFSPFRGLQLAVKQGSLAFFPSYIVLRGAVLFYSLGGKLKR